MSENKETLDLSSSATEDKSEVKGPSVKIQPMDGILKNIIEQMQKKNVSEEQDEDYEKLVDQIDNELSEDESDGASEDDDDDDEMEEDVRWTALQKLLDSHQLLCESFNKLLHEEDEE